MAKFVKVPLEQFVQLMEDVLQLNYLESCGVDNWEPGITYSEWLSEQGISEEEDYTIPYEIIEE